MSDFTSRVIGAIDVDKERNSKLLLETELEAETKYEIIETAYNVGLRTLGLYLTMMSENKDDLAEYLANVIIDKYSDRSRADITLKRDDIRKESLRFLADLSYLSSLAIITKISNSVGDDRLNKTFEKILENNPYNSYKLINLSTSLNYPGLPINTIEQYSKEMRNNIMCFRLLQDLVVDHMYKFDVDFKNKSRISSLLGLTIQDQLYIQESSQTKRKE